MKFSITIAALMSAVLATNTTLVTITSCDGGCTAAVSSFEGNAQMNQPMGYAVGGVALAAGALLAL